MQEDDNLRRKHQDQPYQETTTSLLHQYSLDFNPIKAMTTRSDIIITSTLKFSVQKKHLELNFESFHPSKPEGIQKIEEDNCEQRKAED